MATVNLTVLGEDQSKPVRDGLINIERAIGMVKTAAATLGVSLSLMALVGLAKDTAMLSARYETLGVSMRVVGNNAGYTGDQMEQFEAKLRRSGIAMVESRQNLTSMSQAHIDLAKSADLARIAQDAAVVGGINSSQAFSQLVYGIQSAQTDVLRTIGINVNFEESYKKLGQQIGKSAESLTEFEKTQARTNAVMEKGKDLAGTYEAAMGTAGKQLNSLKRYWDDLKVTAGETFNEAMLIGVQQVTGGLKDLNDEAGQLKQKGDLQRWGKDLVYTMAAVADVVRYTGSLIATFTGTTVAGLMQIYKVGEAAWRLAQGDFAAAKQSLQDIGAIGAAWFDDMKKRWSGESFTATANKFYAEREANAGRDKALAAEAEKRRIAAGEAARKEIASKQAAEAAEKKYLENLKPTLEGIKSYTAAVEDLGRQRLSFENERYTDKLKEELDLYKEGKRAVEDLSAPLRRYSAEVNDVFNRRLQGERSSLDKISALYAEFGRKISLNALTKEAKGASLEILKQYRDTARGIISTEQDRYKTLLDGERAYANQVLGLIQTKKKELQDLKQRFSESNGAFDEKMRSDLQGGYVQGQFRYLDSTLDAYDKRLAQVAELRRKESEYDAITDPAKKQEKILGLVTAWEQLTGEVKVNGDTLVTSEDSYRQVLEERQRLQEKVAASAEDEQRKLEALYQKSIDKVETYKDKLLDLDNVLSRMSRTITIDLEVNGLEQIGMMRAAINQATQSPFIPASQPAPASGSGLNPWDYYQSGDSFYWGDGTYGGPAYAKGTPYVPQTGLALVHQGEEIKPSGRNAAAPGISVSFGDIIVNLPAGTPQQNARETAREIYRELEKLSGRKFAA